MGKHELLWDMEGNGLLDTITKQWTDQIGEVDEEEVDIYADQPGFRPLSEATARLKKAERIIGHNVSGYDIFAKNKFAPGTVTPDQLFDTQVAARMIWRNYKTHSLRDWGERLGILKGDYTGDFQQFDDELVKYAGQDIHVTRALYKLIRKKMEGWDWAQSMEMEFLFRYIISLQEQNGFTLDVAKVAALQGELNQEMHDITKELQGIFPPIVTERYSDKQVDKETGKPKRLKDKVEVFNPGSRQQIARRLKAKYGWKPTEFTEKGQPQIDEKVMKGLPWPEAKVLARYLSVSKQVGQIQGKKGWLKFLDLDTNRVHGRVNTMGADTSRCSHSSPNMAQVSKKDIRMREVWIPRKGWKLVGVDADGLEFVALAHYLQPYDKGVTIERVLNGDKKLGTDVHSANRDAVITALRSTCNFPEPSQDVMGKLRDSAKTLIYALMYGAGDAKLGETIVEVMRMLGVNHIDDSNLYPLGDLARKALAVGMPGLDKLVDAVKKRAKKQGFIKGIDGRKVFIRSEHSALNFLLQSAGAIVMKLALVIFHFEKVEEKGWVHSKDFGYCANVHDEVQIEARPEIAQDIGDTFAECITLAAQRLGFRCPLSGSAQIGDNWADTH